MGGGAGPTTWMAGQTYSAAAEYEAQQDCRRAKEAECRCQEEGRPGGGGQGEAGHVDDQAQAQGLDYVY